MRLCVRYLKLYFAKSYLSASFFAGTTVKTFFYVLGVFLLLFRLADIFIDKLPTYFPDNTWGLLIVLSVSLIVTLILRRPVLEISEKIRDVDSIVKIKVGDALELPQACVVSTTTTFDTDTTNGLIAPKSLQGRVTATYYNHHSHLDADIDGVLADHPFENLSDAQQRKGKTKRYPLGTVVKISPIDRNFYLLAVANMNHLGNAQSSFQMVSDSLAALWTYLGEKGDYEANLLIPVLGTGHGRIPESREEVIREIIGSFIAASLQKRICDTLTVLIYREDYYRLQLEMEELRLYLMSQCRYSGIRKNPGKGTAEPSTPADRE